MLGKRLICISLAIVLLFVTACGDNDPVVPDIDETIVEENGDEAPDDTQEQAPAQREEPVVVERPPGIPINWGTSFTQREIDPASPILDYFHARFGVNLDVMHVPNNITGNEPLPDIFYGNAQRLYDQGITRAIPRSMIEQHAPGYAALMESIPYGWELGRIGDTDNYTGLYIYDISKTYLTDFSVYRLDWMETLGIAPPGNPNDMEEVIEGVYFTPHSFTQAEFVDVMRAFSVNELSAFAPINRGMGVHTAVVGIDEFGTVHDPMASLLGMWGLNLNNMNINGSVMPYYVTEQYRSFLTFIRQMGYTDDLVAFFETETQPRGFPSFRTTQEAGWSSLHVDVIPIVFERQINRPTNRYLITPPEIGPNGQRGSAGKHSGSLFDMDGQWVISKDVSDVFLAYALQVFDALAFDPEAYVTAMFGLDMRDFIWEGEPYNSGIVLRRNRRSDRARMRNGVGLFDPLVIDGNAGKMVYYNGMTNPVYNFAASQQGLDMVVWPYKYDLTGSHTAAFDTVRSTRGALNRIATQHYRLFLQDEETPVNGETWAAYMEALNEAGLQDYIAYLSLLDDVDGDFVAKEAVSTYVPIYVLEDDGVEFDFMED
jgi:hypothetical protein